MTVKECDRCGKIMPYDEAKTTGGGCRIYMTCEELKKEFDLCPKCQKEFLQNFVCLTRRTDNDSKM